MAVLEGGTSTALAGVGAEAASPLHSVIKPLHGNHYRVARRFVPAGTTLAGILWMFRNPTASGLVMPIKRVWLRALQVGAPTAAIEDIFTLRVARAFTAADTIGVSIAPAANNNEMRTSMGAAAAQLREASIAAGLTAGTRTLDTDAIATGSLWVAAALASGQSNGPTTIFDYYPNVADGEHPLATVADEGFEISNTNNFGATSGIILHLEIYWAEVTVY